MVAISCSIMICVALALAAIAALPSAPPVRSDFIRGMGFAHVHVPFFGYGSSRAKEQLERLRELGVDWIALNPFGYMPAVDRPELSFGERDPTLGSQDLITQIADAHRLGIKVLLKPHLWSRDFSRGKWGGDIAMKSEEDYQLFFDRYTQFIVAEARIAQRGQADALLIGLELVQLTKPEHTARWRRLIALVREVYSGPLTYGAHHEHEAFQIEFWDQLDAIGVHGYFPLAVDEKTATADAIAAAWLPHLTRLEPLTERFKKPLVFTEIGYPAHQGALREPWRSDGDLPEDQHLQAIAYEGTIAALNAAPYVRGVFFWKWFSGGRHNPAESDPYEPTEREAERVIGRWFVRR